MSESRPPQVAGPLSSGAVRVWWAACQPLTGLDLTSLSPEEHARVNRLGTEPARQRSALARVVLRAALADALGAPPASFALEWSRGPALLGEPGSPDVPWLSVSHSAERVVVALATAGQVGVDIETAARGERLRPTVVERITTPVERAALAKMDGPARERAAIQLWTAKEAILKATKEGLTVEPHTVEIVGLPEAVRLTAHGSRPELVGASQLSLLVLDGDYVGSLAVLTSAGRVRVDERDAAPLLSPRS